jgi:hypothetical protein
MYIFTYLGKETINIVYTIELIGILIGLEIVIKVNIRKIVVFIDN